VGYLKEHEMEGKRYDSLMAMKAQQKKKQQQIQASMVENKLILSLLSKLVNN